MYENIRVPPPPPGPLLPGGGGGGGGGTLILSCIRRLGSFFGVQNFEFNIFLGSSQNWTIFMGHSYAF